MKKFLVIMIMAFPVGAIACPTSAEEKAKYFNEHDTDKDGYLNLQEYKLQIEKNMDNYYKDGKVSMFEAGTEKKAKKIIVDTDSNKDGKISLQEFSPMNGRFRVPKCI